MGPSAQMDTRLRRRRLRKVRRQALETEESEVCENPFDFLAQGGEVTMIELLLGRFEADSEEGTVSRSS